MAVASGAAVPPLGARTLQRVPIPRLWEFRFSDLVWLVAGNAVLILAMWLRHGGLDQLGDLSGQLTAAGQLTALYGTFLALLGLVLVARSPWLDQLAGMHRLATWHRWIGFAVIWLLVAHTVLTTAGYALGDGSGLAAETWTLISTYPYVLMGTVALLLLIAVGILSMTAARRRISYGSWYAVHLYTYLAMALGFGHQLVVGSDFQDDPVARFYWIMLYILTALLILLFRFGQPIYLSLRHRLRVADVVTEAPGVVSVYVRGRKLEELAVRAGQYFVWRFFTGDSWWRGRPFSLSAAPNGKSLRLTMKADGAETSRLLRLKRGTWVGAEGPYGILTGARRTHGKVLLIAGGIGITPLRALAEELPAGRGEITLLYRASDWSDAVFADELDRIGERRGMIVHYLIGRRGDPAIGRDPLAAGRLRELVPDVAERDIFICGPVPMIDAVRRALRTLRVPASQVHVERFSY